MSEAGWIQILTLLLAAITPPVLLILKAKFDQRLDNIHHELNSRLDQWKAETVQATTDAVAAALARGKLEGAEAMPAAPAEGVKMEVEHMEVEVLNVPPKKK
jgi:hypothetical protein